MFGKHLEKDGFLERRITEYLQEDKKMEKGFRRILAERQKKTNSLVCVGLDPLEEKIPECIHSGETWDRIASHMKEIIKATAKYACMFKPQVAHYEAIYKGRKALQSIVEFIHDEHPDIPVFLDCKRGDIDRTQKQYRIAHFEIDGVDGMNFNPYMGKDCMEQLVDRNRLGRAIVGLCYTSNPAAREIQDLIVSLGPNYYSPLWEIIASKTLRWAEELGIVENAGLVMAAAYEKVKGSGEIYSEHLSRCREIVGDKLWFLIPGIGTQGGFVKETVKAAFMGPGSIVINSSSGIIFASSGNDFAEAARREARKLAEQIRETRRGCS